MVFLFLARWGTTMLLFRSGSTNLHSHQQFLNVHFSPHFCLFLVYLKIAILTGVRWYFIGELIFISLMISDTEYLFMRLLNIFKSSWKRCILKSSSHFKIRFKFLFILSFMNSLYILFVNPLLHISFANIFSHSVNCLSNFAGVFLSCAEVL